MASSVRADQVHQSKQGRHILYGYLLLASLLLAAASYWAPWIDHDAAALRLTGQDMGEFVKFLPASREGHQNVRKGQVPRQLFYVPPLVSGLCLVLLAANAQLGYPIWLRAVLIGWSALLLLGLLPPVWGHPRELIAGDFRLQGYALVLGILLVLGHGLFRKLSLGVLVSLVSILSATALSITQSAFWLIRPRLWAAGNSPTLSLGWGLWLHIAAWAATTGLGAYIYAQRTGA
jgi:hypothetical protein